MKSLSELIFTLSSLRNPTATAALNDSVISLLIYNKWTLSWLALCDLQRIWAAAAHDKAACTFEMMSDTMEMYNPVIQISICCSERYSQSDFNSKKVSLALWSCSESNQLISNENIMKFSRSNIQCLSFYQIFSSKCLHCKKRKYTPTKHTELRWFWCLLGPQKESPFLLCNSISLPVVYFIAPRWSIKSWCSVSP